MKLCRHCGQPVPTRCGVILTPMKARIFDLIQQCSARGVWGHITPETLAGILYPGTNTRIAISRIKTQVCQINDILAETDFRIRTGYRLIKRGGKHADRNGSERGSA